MPNSADSQDMGYQPKAEGFSYKNPVNYPSTDNSETKPSLNPLPRSQTNKPQMNIFITLLGEILGLLVLFFIFLAVINYFNIIALRNISPQAFSWLPHIRNSYDLEDTPAKDTIYHDSKNNVWTITGSLNGYRDNVIEVRFNGEIKKFEFLTNQSTFFKSDTRILQPIPIPDTLSGLQSPENIGKKLQVVYREENPQKRVIQTIVIYEY